MNTISSDRELSKILEVLVFFGFVVKPFFRQIGKLSFKGRASKQISVNSELCTTKTENTDHICCMCSFSIYNRNNNNALPVGNEDQTQRGNCGRLQRFLFLLTFINSLLQSASFNTSSQNKLFFCISQTTSDRITSQYCRIFTVYVIKTIFSQLFSVGME